MGDLVVKMMAERDEARAELAALRDSDEALRLPTACESRLGSELTDALVGIERLRGALKRYGAHDVLCHKQYRHPCNCGLDDALTGTTADPKTNAG